MMAIKTKKLRLETPLSSAADQPTFHTLFKSRILIIGMRFNFACAKFKSIRYANILNTYEITVP